MQQFQAFLTHPDQEGASMSRLTIQQKQTQRKRIIGTRAKIYDGRHNVTVVGKNDGRQMIRRQKCTASKRGPLRKPFGVRKVCVIPTSSPPISQQFRANSPPISRQFHPIPQQFPRNFPQIPQQFPTNFPPITRQEHANLTLVRKNLVNKFPSITLQFPTNYPIHTSTTTIAHQSRAISTLPPHYIQVLLPL